MTKSINGMIVVNTGSFAIDMIVMTVLMLLMMIVMVIVVMDRILGGTTPATTATMQNEIPTPKRKRWW
jgi:hypothetical protein